MPIVGISVCPESGRWPYGPASAVGVNEQLVCFSNGSTLMVAEMTEEGPQVVGEAMLAGVPFEIALTGDHAYILVEGYGIEVPVILGS